LAVEEEDGVGGGVAVNNSLHCWGIILLKNVLIKAAVVF